MTILYNPIPMSFGGAIAAASGNIVQWTYTVPPGKRAILINCTLRATANAGAVNSSEIYIDIIPVVFIVSMRVLTLNTAGLAAHTSKEYAPHINLSAGDLVRGLSGSAAGSALYTGLIQAFIREYL